MDCSQVRRSINKKYDSEAETAVLQWIAGVLGEADLFDGVAGQTAVHQKLKDGVILCRLIEKIEPGSTENLYRTNAKSPFEQMNNLGIFNNAMRDYGVKSEYIFVTSDLHSNKNMVQVLIGLRALATTASEKGVRPQINI